MTAIKPSIKDILCLEKISVVLEKSYEMEPFAMGHHVYKGKWTSFAGEKLDTAMQLNDVKDKYVVAIFQEGKSSVIFPLESLESLQRLFFIFSKQLKKTDAKESLMVKLSIRMMAWG